MGNLSRVDASSVLHAGGAAWFLRRNTLFREITRDKALARFPTQPRGFLATQVFPRRPLPRSPINSDVRRLKSRGLWACGSSRFS